MIIVTSVAYRVGQKVSPCGIFFGCILDAGENHFFLDKLECQMSVIILSLVIEYFVRDVTISKRVYAWQMGRRQPKNPKPFLDMSATVNF